MVFEKMFAVLTILFISIDIGYSVCTDCDTEYCKISGQHTLCKYKDGPAPKCVDYQSLKFTSEIQDHIVIVHNDVRDKVASGEEKKGILNGQPEAANMQKLEWDQELADIAQRWADQCVQFDKEQHDAYKNINRFEVGQNILTATKADATAPDVILLIMHWYKQVQYVFSADVERFTDVTRGNRMFGQYSQMVWAGSRYIGCGMARFKKVLTNGTETEYYLFRLVCNYGPTGNVYGEPMYIKGPPCSKCKSKRCDTRWTYLCGSSVKTGHMNDTISNYLEYITDNSVTVNDNIHLKTPQYEILYFNPDETTIFKNETGLILEDLILAEIEKNKTIDALQLNYNISDDFKLYFGVADSWSTPKSNESGEDKVNYFRKDMDILEFIIPKHGQVHKITKSNTPNDTVKKVNSANYYIKGQGYFYRTSGIWYNGHCKCEFLYRSNQLSLYGKSPILCTLLLCCIFLIK